MVDERIMQLVKTEGFHRIVEENMKRSKTVKEAYELAEKEYKSNFGETRYSGYDSYRKTRERLIRNGK